MAGPADSEEATPARDRSTTRQTRVAVFTEVVALTEEVSVVAVVVLTEAVVAASVEEADLTGVVAAVAVVPAQVGVVALPQADLTNRPLTRGLIAKHRRGRAVHNQSCRPFGLQPIGRNASPSCKHRPAN
jgi:hypothetical protein